MYHNRQGRRNSPDQPDLGLASIFQTNKVEATHCCIAYFYAAVVLGWKPGQSSKFQHVLATKEALTGFHRDEAIFFFF